MPQSGNLSHYITNSQCLLKPALFHQLQLYVCSFSQILLKKLKLYTSGKMEATAEAFPDSGSLSRKIVAVAAGEAHTLALSGDGYVYSWGRGMFGRLGNGSESDELFPIRIKFENTELKIIAVAAGAYHSLALADDGSVWSWGYNIYMDGQLGLNGENSLTPQLLERFLEFGSLDQSKDELNSEIKSEAPLKICAVKAGGMTSLAIDNLGALWMWGNCPQENSGGDGGLTFVSSFTPVPVWDFHGHTVVKVACGNEHVVALVSAGERYKGDDLLCYSWGGNGHGQLGLGDIESRVHPEIVTFSQDSVWTPYEVACGAFHTALLSRKKRPSDRLESRCWTFGLGDKGQLGHGTTQSALIPEPVEELPEPVYIVSVDCGLFHTSVVSSAGDVWSWGMEKGLGLCPEASFTGTDLGDAISPLKISADGVHGPRFSDPIQVSCGAAHTILVEHDGYKLWSWGRGRSGVLGNGRTIDCFAPSLVLWPPLNEDFKQEELNDTVGKDDKTVDHKVSDGGSEVDKKLSLAMEEIKLLQSKLSIMERYTSILHGSIFGKPFEEQDISISLQNSGTFDIAREWENMLESSDRSKLVRMELFYRNMLAGVKDKIMKRRIQELIKECLPSSAQGQ